MNTLRRRLTRALDARTLRGAELGTYEIEIERDLRVPMDDGIDLLADLIRPVDPDALKLPTVLIRGPYGRRGLVAASARALAYDGFTVLFQSCRGTRGSGGLFTPQLDEQRDGLATHRWLRSQPWFTGTLVTYGASYLGFTQWAVAGRLQRETPEIAPDACVLLITMPDFGEITWDHGAFALRNALGWSRMMDRMVRRVPEVLILLPDPKLARAFDVLPLSDGDTAATGHPIHWYQDWVAHERLGDDYWTRQSHTASVPEVTCPVLMVTGWYDIFLPWQLRTYTQLVDAGNQPRLTIGPWGHVSPEMGAPTHSDTVAFLTDHFTAAPSARTAPVRAFQTGAEQWHDLPSWPPVGSTGQCWFLQSTGALDRAEPLGGVTQYVYEPNDPTPSLGGPSLLPDTDPVDNAAHERRRDVAVFRSERLRADLDLAGEPLAKIRMRSSVPSFDLFVRITDVHPDGRAMTVCDGIRRIGSTGTAPSDPAPDDDGFREIDIALWPTFHRFAVGHRIGVQISSGAHPRYARNPGTGEPAGVAARTVPSRQQLSHDGPGASQIELPVWSPTTRAHGNQAADSSESQRSIRSL